MSFHTITEPENQYLKKRLAPTPKTKWARQSDPYGLVRPRDQVSEPVKAK